MVYTLGFNIENKHFGTSFQSLILTSLNGITISMTA